MLGPGPLEIPGNRQAEPLPIGQREGLHQQEVVSTTREVQTLEVCLQQGVALPAGGVKEDFEDIWSGPARKGRISTCRDGESLCLAEQTLAAGRCGPGGGGGREKSPSAQLPPYHSQLCPLL